MKVMKRSEIDEKFKWDLSSIVASDSEWDNLLKKVKQSYKHISDYKGKLNNGDTILECLNYEDELSLDIERLYTYAKMKQDEDANVNKYQAMTSKIEQLSVLISSEASFIVPELNNLPSEELLEFSRESRFAPYDYSLTELVRKKAHILSDKEEKILSEVSGFSDGFHDAFNMFDSVDVTFKSVTDEKGDEMEMSHGVYSLCLQSNDRRIRQEGFESMFGAFKGMVNTIAQLYNGNVKKDCFYAKIRGYESALDMALSSENVDTTVYTNLCESVHDALPSLHEYIEFRKKALGVDELHSWDMHVGIVEGESLALDYDKACKLVKEALLPLGAEYQTLLDKSFTDKWIDVYENKGKRSGAYSWGSYNAHPYVLLNYQKTTHDIFTIAHELGHSMHSYYSNANQLHSKAGYEIFVAEVASTVNEVLLLKFLIGKADTKLRTYLLSYYLDMFRTTMFRQTQFAEFEMLAHQMVENGEPLTPDNLCDVYAKLNAEYYGEALAKDDLIKYEWARIPHFYRSFYVYKYSTGIISAVKIVNDILSGDDEAVARYFKFLGLGGSMSPVEILKVAGVDLTTKAPFESVKAEFDNALNELKKCF